MSDEHTPTIEQARAGYVLACYPEPDPRRHGAADAFDRAIESVRAAERERIAQAIEDLPTTWPNGVKHSAAWMRLEAADAARQGAWA